MVESSARLRITNSIRVILPGEVPVVSPSAVSKAPRTFYEYETSVDSSEGIRLMAVDLSQCSKV